MTPLTSLAVGAVKDYAIKKFKDFAIDAAKDLVGIPTINEPEKNAEVKKKNAEVIKPDHSRVIKEVATVMTLPNFCVLVISGNMPLNENILFIKNRLKVQNDGKMNNVKRPGEIRTGAEIGVLVVFKNLNNLKNLGAEIISEDDDTVVLKFTKPFNVPTEIQEIKFFKSTFDNFFRTTFASSQSLKQKASVFLKKIKPADIKVTSSIPTF